MYRDDVLKPLGTSPDSWETVRTDNSVSGKINGTQVLAPSALDASMQRDPADRGVTTSGSVAFTYDNQFWAKEFKPSEFPQLTCSFRTPFMSGYGGITVAMAPNGATHWTFSDNSEFSWSAAVLQTGRINPLC